MSGKYHELTPVVDVSIVAANYNNGPFLDDFMVSIIDSACYPKELIIIDDASTDNSLQILKAYEWLPFLNIIPLKNNVGLASALNMGLEMASSKYIMRLDPDDVIDSTKIGIQFEYLEEHPSVDVLGTNAYYFTKDKNIRINTTNFPEKHDSIYQRFYNGQFGVLHGTIMAKASVIKAYPYFNARPVEYVSFSNMIKDGYQFHNLSQVLYGVRIHGDSFVSTMKYTQYKNLFGYRDSIFQTKTSSGYICLLYYHIYFYRKYMLTENVALKYCFLIMSIILQPGKLLARTKTYFLRHHE
jgi:glycosyltransferase involved in cell wall biosynthesis